jgi:hypothetical protein
MNQDTTIERLYEIIKPDVSLIEHNIIIQHDGVYHLFGQFEIHHVDQVYRVIKFCDVKCDFYNLSSAVSWCIAEKIKNYHLSREIEQLDLVQGRLRIDLSVSEQLLEKSRNTDYREVVRLKIAAKKQVLKETQNRLSKCVNTAKYFQTKGFNDEIARTRRPTQNTTTVPNVRKSNRTKNRI